MTTTADRDSSLFGDVISTYTRAQAIEDGVLVDVTDMAREAGFKFPVAITSGVHNACVRVPEGATGQDEPGRLWDILSVLMLRIKAGARGTTVRYSLSVVGEAGHRSTVELYSVCGPGDDLAPVVTIMLVGED